MAKLSGNRNTHESTKELDLGEGNSTSVIAGSQDAVPDTACKADVGQHPNPDGSVIHKLPITVSHILDLRADV